MSRSNSAAPRTLGPTIVLGGLFAGVARIGTNLWRSILVLGRAQRAKPPRIGGGAIIAVAVTIAAIVASMFLLEPAASDWARQLPTWVTEPADAITNFGLSGRFLYPLGFIILLLSALIGPWLQPVTQGVLMALVARFGFLFIAIGLPSLFDTIIKRVIGRARPYIGPRDNPFVYKPFVWSPEYASMPSGHATTAAAAAIAIGAIWPRSRIVMWAYALIIMFSRVVINVHHPSDVIAGGLVGVVGALMVRRWFAARGLVFFADDLRPYPGPSWRRLKIAALQIVGSTTAPAT
jgi:membrane-associated phospholipid phosphatase